MKDLTFAFGPDVEGYPSADAAARHSNREFVRGEGGLAVYEAARKPTGHILSAWEAYTSFGLDVLEEAVEYGSAILRSTTNATTKALRNRREELGLTQKSVNRAAKVSESEVKMAESHPSKIPFKNLERIAFVLGLDERFLAFKESPGGDSQLAYRLKTLLNKEQNASRSISAGTALLFAEASSIIRVQHRLQKWLGLQDERDEFSPNPDYGSPQNPAFRIGYNLAEEARRILRLGESPIESLRDLVEKRLGIPVIQARLPGRIAGATVATTDEDGKEVRGVVLNTVGDNENVWIRRATLAHELGHLLYDPNTRLNNVRVDSYSDNRKNPEAPATDFVEQRANAFAIAFLAPNDAVKRIQQAPFSEESVANLMHTFGISYTAARYHISNCHYRQYPVPTDVYNVAPSDEQKAAENFTVDYFPIPDTPGQRRGRFASLVLECCEKGLISEDTAAFYLGCSTENFNHNADILREIYPRLSSG